MQSTMESHKRRKHGGSGALAPMDLTDGGIAPMDLLLVFFLTVKKTVKRIISLSPIHDQIPLKCTRMHQICAPTLYAHNLRPQSQKHLMQGDFSVQLGGKNPFGRIPVDQMIEETVNKTHRHLGDQRIHANCQTAHAF